MLFLTYFIIFLFQLQKLNNLTIIYGSNCTALSYQLDLLITKESNNDTLSIYDYEDLNNITAGENNSAENNTFDKPQFQVCSTITFKHN